MFMFLRMICNRLRGRGTANFVDECQGVKTASDNEELELLKLKYEKLQYIHEQETDRDKTVEAKASMFIGSTSIMGAIIIGCANLVSAGSASYSYVNLCILMFVLILIYYLGRSITYSVLTLRKRTYWYLGINDLEGMGNMKTQYERLIESTIKIIKHNEAVINSKVDSMQIAQESFVDFWIWSGLFFLNLLAYHVFHAYGIELSLDTIIWVLVTMTLSGIGYLAIISLVESLKKTDADDAKPNVEEAIRSVCMMMVSNRKNEDEIEREMCH